MTATVPPVVPARPSEGPSLLRRLLRRRVAAGSLVLLALIVVACLAAPLFLSAGPNAGDLGQSLQGPSGAHLLGTDSLGRDVLSRLLYGGRPSLFYAGVVALVALLVGIPLGMVAGYRGGWVDRWVMTGSDIGLATPVMIVVIVVLSVFRDYFLVAMVALGLLLVPAIVRSIRGPVLAIRRELFIDAAVVAGLSTGQILVRHVLPRVAGPVLVQAALVTAMAVQFTVGLAFLGFGPPPPDPTWGSMIADGARELSTAPWLLLFSGALVAGVILCLGLLGDAIRDVTVESWSGEAPARASRASGRALVTSNADPCDTSALLSVRGLSVAFGVDGDERPVASNVSFDIHAGETVGLVGESGCGKSSIARALVRLLRSGGRMTAGEICFQGRDVLGLSGKDLANYRGGSVAYIAQEPMSALDPTYRVGAQIEGVLRAHEKLSRRAASRRVIELLESVHLPNAAHVARSYPHELSGGMAQRVAIARAIAGRPGLLIADEPTTALDVTVQAGILELLRSLQRERGLAILLVSHDWGAVAELCDRSLVMYAGELVERGATEELLDSPAHPYTDALVACRPSDITDSALPLPVIAGSVPAPGEWPSYCRFASRCSFCSPACTSGPVPFLEIGAGRAARCVRAESPAFPLEVDTHA